MLTADDVSLQSAFIDLPPAGMQTWKNFILALADQRLHLLQAEFGDPLTIGEHVAHAAVKHGHSHGSVFHQHTQHLPHVL